ncbi:MAG TPA: SHOCT domain-containing protein [Burkholderiales bacterium]|nr:SHOCT domain-containing protein [Burkholderiales bacterium]
MMHGFGWGPGFEWIFMILFWGLAIIGIAAIARWFLERRSWRPQPCERTALDILQERYARGEIDREEYEQKRHNLQL